MDGRRKMRYLSISVGRRYRECGVKIAMRRIVVIIFITIRAIPILFLPRMIA